MERTKKNLPFDNTPKPLKRQGFSESRFQNGPSFSSQAHYNRFDCTARLVRETVSCSMPYYNTSSPGNCQSPAQMRAYFSFHRQVAGPLAGTHADRPPRSGREGDPFVICMPGKGR